MTWEIQRKPGGGSTLLDSVATQAALLALDPVEYQGKSVIVEGLNYSSWTSNGTIFIPTSGQYVHLAVNSPRNNYVFPAVVTWTVADNGAGKVRLTSNIAHGIIEANAEDSMLYLVSGGTGWTAGTSHRITAGTGFISTTQLDLDTNFTGGMGIPVFAVAGTTEAASELILYTTTLPILRATTIVSSRAVVRYSIDSSTNPRRFKMYLESTELYNLNRTATNTATDPCLFEFANQDAATSQRSTSAFNGSGYTNNTQDVATAAVDTSVAGKVLSFRCMSNVVGITARVESLVITIIG